MADIKPEPTSNQAAKVDQLVERLQELADEDEMLLTLPWPSIKKAFIQAADEIQRLTGELGKLIAAIGEHVTVRSDYLARAQSAEASLARMTDEVGAVRACDRAGLRSRLTAALMAEGIALEIGSREFYALESAFNGRVADEQKARAERAEASLSQLQAERDSQ